MVTLVHKRIGDHSKSGSYFKSGRVSSGCLSGGYINRGLWTYKGSTNVKAP